MRMFNLSMLGLCIALAQGAAVAAPSLAFKGQAVASEYSQWLAPLPFMHQAERLQVAAKALQVVDAQGRVLGELAGRFETLDHRADANGLLVATSTRSASRPC